MMNTHSITRLLAPLVLAVACQSTPSSTSSEAPTHTDGSLVPAKLTPELIERSEKILSEHTDAPIGTDIPLRVNGRRYLARIEMHEDDAKGKHKGVTLYEVK